VEVLSIQNNLVNYVQLGTPEPCLQWCCVTTHKHLHRQTHQKCTYT